MPGTRPRNLDEAELGRLLAAGRAAENSLAAAVGQPMADLDEVSELRRRVRAGEDARIALLDASQHLVDAIARKRCDGRSLTPLLLAGEDALQRAIDRYDPTGGLAFSAFARWWIERAIREEERHSEPPVDPRLLTALGHLHQDDCRVIELRLGLDGAPPRSPAVTADAMGVSVEEEAERETKALAKLRHPCTPGDLTHLKRL